MILQQHVRSNVLMATACGGLFTYGIISALLGAILPELRARLGFQVAAAGWLFAASYASQIPTAFVTGWLIDFFGKKPVFLSSCLLTVTAVLGIAYVMTYASLVALVLALGVAGSLISSSSNTLVADIYPETPSSALNIGHAFYGLGAVFVPVLVVLLVKPLGIQSVMWSVAALVGGIGAVGLLEPFPGPHTSGALEWPAMGHAAFTRSLLLLTAVAFLTTALLASLAAWIRIFFEQGSGASAQGSSMILALFWGLVSLGRLAGSHLVRKIRGALLVLWASFGLVVGLVILAVAPSLQFAAPAIALCGLCYAPIYPTTVGITHSLFPKFFATAFGILMAASLVGGFVLPVVVGYVAAGRGVRAGICVLVGSATLLFGIQMVFVRIEQARDLL
jgi:fucose permease